MYTKFYSAGVMTRELSTEAFHPSGNKSVLGIGVHYLKYDSGQKTLAFWWGRFLFQYDTVRGFWLYRNAGIGGGA